MKNYFYNESLLLDVLNKNSAFIAIDEVGRGCIAGPVLSCASLWVLKSSCEQPEWVSLIRDSKLLSPKKRKICFDLVLKYFSLESDDIPLGQEDPSSPNLLVPSAKSFHFNIEENTTVPFGQREERQFECLGFALGEASAHEVDAFNIWNCVQLATARALKNLYKETKITGLKLQSYLNSAVLLMDGKLKIKVPPEFRQNIQVTCVKADEQFVSVGFSSIIAKVVRDTFMETQEVRFPSYLFAKHKGYGTAQHFSSIQKNGQCPLHRKTFLE